MIDIEKIINDNNEELEKEIKKEYNSMMDDNPFEDGNLPNIDSRLYNFEVFKKYIKVKKDADKNGMTIDHINAMNMIKNKKL